MKLSNFTGSGKKLSVAIQLTIQLNSKKEEKKNK
jgi:hypothetical protein